ncbi:hypothetical protein MSj_02753 [Microcystis aeruginosa Sj]|jgi:hypothetical protein|uniref:DUF5615 family PIN-like protein n=2 Tax=Microcystis aeruginosa TaxID=1126 RepID=A0A841VAM8_MICAE|nr:DUF5615 family PIN-like protein [Microcystis aeruginosa]MBC1197246.1 DUF5615 family PIN-like protein [Microcystis aeruginosa BLCC-F158]GBL11251.1 hypothetical protein MSj_02753 [Microcystis aeruginosa Sj]
MLSFLLDEHISPTVAEQISYKRPEISIFPLITWQKGRYLGDSDEIVLKAAAEAGLTLVTYDQNSIPPLLWEWGEAWKSHSGVIFIDYESIPPSNFGLLIRSLLALWELQGKQDWTNRLVYLKPKV